VESILDHLFECCKLASLSQNQVYAHASGVFNFLCNKLVARKVARKWEFTQTFLNAVSSSHKVISNAPDQGKREILTNLVSLAFATYTTEWGHLPFFDGKSADALLKSSLQGVGYELNGTPFRLNAEMGERREGRGLRFEAFSGFTILHLIAHDEIPLARRVCLCLPSRISAPTLILKKERFT